MKPRQPGGIRRQCGCSKVPIPSEKLILEDERDRKFMPASAPPSKRGSFI
jgi:hypothetical protein